MKKANVSNKTIKEKNLYHINCQLYRHVNLKIIIINQIKIYTREISLGKLIGSKIHKIHLFSLISTKIPEVTDQRGCHGLQARFWNSDRTVRFDQENLKPLIFTVLLALRTPLWEKSKDLCEQRLDLTVLRIVIRPLLMVPYFPLNLNLKKNNKNKNKNKTQKNKL